MRSGLGVIRVKVLVNDFVTEVDHLDFQDGFSFDIRVPVILLFHDYYKIDNTNLFVQNFKHPKSQNISQIVISMNFLLFSDLEFSTSVAVGMLFGLMFASLLNYALYKFIIHEVIEEVHTYTNGSDNVLRTILHCILMNANFIIIGLVACFTSPIISLQMCLQSDAMMILVGAGIVIFIEESRQTKLDPFLVTRDLTFYFIALVLVLVQMVGDNSNTIPALLLVLGAVYLIFQYLNNFFQYKFYKIFDLVENQDFSGPQILATHQKSKESITQLEKIVSEQSQRIQLQVSNFFKLINRAVPKQRDRRMYRKFSEIVVPIIKAIQIKGQRDKVKRSQIYSKHWYPREDSQNQPQPQFLRIDQLSENSKSSYAAQTINRVETFYSVEQKDESKIDKVTRIVFYPLYFISKLNTDMKYVLYLLCLVLEVGLLFFVYFACQYLGKGWAKPKLFSFIMSLLLSVPNLTYSIQVSEGGDHDFYNLFIQSGIWKLTLFVPIFFLLNINQGSNIIPTISHQIYVGVKLLTIVVFIIFFIVRKLNMKRQSVKYPFILHLVSTVGSLIVICF